jgi:hypothetical protein
LWLVPWPLPFDRSLALMLRCPSDHVRPHPLLLPVHSCIDLSMLLYHAGDWPVRGLENHPE